MYILIRLPFTWFLVYGFIRDYYYNIWSRSTYIGTHINNSEISHRNNNNIIFYDFHKNPFISPASVQFCSRIYAFFAFIFLIIYHVAGFPSCCIATLTEKLYYCPFRHRYFASASRASNSVLYYYYYYYCAGEHATAMTAEESQQELGVDGFRMTKHHHSL